MPDVTLTIGFRAESGGVKAIKTIKGSLKEVSKEAGKISLGEFPKELAVTNKDLKKLSKEILVGGKSLEKMGGSAAVVVRQMNKLVKRGSRYYKMVTGAKGNLVLSKEMKKTEYEHLKKINQQQRIYFKNIRTTAKSQEYLRRSMVKILQLARQKAINNYVTQIQQMRHSMQAAGFSAEQVKEHLKALHAQMQKLRRVNMARVASTIQKLGGGEAQARGVGGRMLARQKGIMGAGVAGAKKAISAKKMANQVTDWGQLTRQIGIKLSGAIGFTLIDIGTNIQKMFQGRRFRGQLAGATSGIAGAIGDAFGGAMGAIARDLGKFVGNIGELLANLLTFQFRMLGSIVGGVIKGLGYTIASGIFGALAGAAAGPAAAVIGAGIFALTALITGGLQTMMAIVTETVDAIADILEKAFNSITAIVSAGLRIVATIFIQTARVIGVMWRNFWRGLVAFTRAGVKEITQVISKLTQDSMMSFMTAEKGAARAAKEVVDKAGMGLGKFMRIAAKIAAEFGMTLADIQLGLFDIVSSGFRTMSKATKIVKAAADLAIMDQTSVSNATNALITVWSNYEGQIKSVAKVSKILAAATTLGRTSLEEMGPAMKLIIPSAARYKISLEDAMATLSAMTQIFGRGSTSSAARYFNRLLEAVYLPSSKAGEALRELGINIDDIQAKISAGKMGPAILDIFEKLRHVPMGDLRKVFPTIQARRGAQIFSPEGLKRLKTVKSEMAGVMKHQAKQLKMGKMLATTVFGRMTNIIKNIKIQYGKFVTDVVKFLFFNKRIEKQWMRINRLMFSPAMQKRLGNFVAGLKNALTPIRNIIRNVFTAVGNLMEKIAAGKFFDPADFQVIGESVRKILAYTSRFVVKLLKSKNVAKALQLVLYGIQKALRGAELLIAFPEQSILNLWETFKNAAKPVIKSVAKIIEIQFQKAFAVAVAGLKIGFLEASIVALKMANQLVASGNWFVKTIIDSVKWIVKFTKVLLKGLMYAEATWAVIADFFNKLGDFIRTVQVGFYKGMKAIVLLMLNAVATVAKYTPGAGGAEAAIREEIKKTKAFDVEKYLGKKPTLEPGKIETFLKRTTVFGKALAGLENIEKEVKKAFTDAGAKVLQEKMVQEIKDTKERLAEELAQLNETMKKPKEVIKAEYNKAKEGARKVIQEAQAKSPSQIRASVARLGSELFANLAGHLPSKVTKDIPLGVGGKEGVRTITTGTPRKTAAENMLNAYNAQMAQLMQRYTTAYGDKNYDVLKGLESQMRALNVWWKGRQPFQATEGKSAVGRTTKELTKALEKNTAVLGLINLARKWGLNVELPTVPTTGNSYEAP